MQYHLYDLQNSNFWKIGSNHNFPNQSDQLNLGCSNNTDPWRDECIHHHTTAVEIYYVSKGTIDILIKNKIAKLTPGILLLVNPGVDHAVIMGKGPIQHYVFKVPSKGDEKIITKLLTETLVKEYMELDPITSLDTKEGYIADLNNSEFINCWLIGLGSAKFLTEKLALAYVDLPDEKTMREVDHKEVLHSHQKSTEWYLTFEGRQIMEVEGMKIDVNPQNLLRVERNVKHKLHEYRFPFRGITLRTPIYLDDKLVFD